MTGRFADNPAYQRYEQQLVQLHRLIAEGKCESDEADQIRDEMDGPWKHLNGQERLRLKGLSGDLYMLQDDEDLETPVVAQSQQDLYEQIKECERQSDWDAILGLLRRRPKSVPDGPVAFTRSKAYNALGHAQIALLFFEYAMRYKHNDLNILALHLMLLRDAGRVAEAIETARRYSQDPNASPSVLIVAADIYLNAVGKEDALNLQQVLNLLETALSRVSPQTPTDISHIEFAYILAAHCLVLLGSRDEAITALEEAQKLQPDDVDVRTLREAVSATNGADHGPFQSADAASAFDRVAENRRMQVFKRQGPTVTTAHPVWGKAA